MITFIQSLYFYYYIYLHILNYTCMLSVTEVCFSLVPQDFHNLSMLHAEKVCIIQKWEAKFASSSLK